jgi:DNA-binding LacI/PurR family transcriptional regulator
MLIRLIQGETVTERQVLLQPELIIRESSGTG